MMTMLCSKCNLEFELLSTHVGFATICPKCMRNYANLEVPRVKATVVPGRKPRPIITDAETIPNALKACAKIAAIVNPAIRAQKKRRRPFKGFKAKVRFSHRRR
jgi:hypothetical protein